MLVLIISTHHYSKTKYLLLNETEDFNWEMLVLIIT